jgi:hypothetical protein
VGEVAAVGVRCGRIRHEGAQYVEELLHFSLFLGGGEKAAEIEIYFALKS